MSATVAIGPDERSDRAAAAVLAPQLTAINEHFEGAISGEDPEALHDLRVAVRRTRTVQRQLQRAFPRKRIAWFRDEFRWLQRATGEARDLDVYALGFGALRDLVSAPARPALEPVLDLLHSRRLVARARMDSKLRSQRSELVLRRWAELLEELAASERPRGAKPIGKLADKRTRKLFTSMLRMGGAIGPSSPAADYHELRKQGKELRYMLELFGLQLHPQEAVKPIVKSLKELQNALGRHQDRVVQIATLRSLREQLAAPTVILALDELLARLQEDELAARGQFASRFATFAAKPQRKALAQIFR